MGGPPSAAGWCWSGIIWPTATRRKPTLDESIRQEMRNLVDGALSARSAAGGSRQQPLTANEP